MKWLLGRIRPREFDSNKQQASELLAILVQGSEKNQKKWVSAHAYTSRLPTGKFDHLGELRDLNAFRLPKSAWLRREKDGEGQKSRAKQRDRVQRRLRGSKDANTCSLA